MVSLFQIKYNYYLFKFVNLLAVENNLCKEKVYITLYQMVINENKRM